MTSEVIFLSGRRQQQAKFAQQGFLEEEKKTSNFNATNLAAQLKSCHCGEAVLKEYEAATVAASGAKVKTAT